MTAGNQTEISKALLRIEESIHRKGWDQPPMMGSLNWLPGGRLTVNPYPIDMSGHPPTILAAMAKTLPANPGAAMEMATDPMTFFGLVVSVEGWQQTRKTAEELVVLHRSKQRLADMPGSQEVRNVQAVTLDGNLWFVMRVRGEKPTVVTLDKGNQPGGWILKSLHSITVTVTRQFSHLGPQAKKLAAMKILRVEDLAK